MPFENLYFYDDSIISTEPFQEGNLIHSSGQENPRVVEAPGDFRPPELADSYILKLRD